MEKVLKNVRLASILIFMLLIIAISFLGVHVQQKGVWSNILPEYNLGMDFSGYKEVHFQLDPVEETKNVYIDSQGNYKGDVITAPSVEELGEYKIESKTIASNDSSKINIENFENTKRIIQERLERNDQFEYNIRQDSITGELVLEIPSVNSDGYEEALVLTQGRLEFVDPVSGLIVLDDSNLVSASPYGKPNEDGTYEVYLQLEFDEAGSEILRQMTNKYMKTIAADGTESTKEIQLRLDAQVLVTTHFEEEISTGIVHVPMADVMTDYEKYHSIYHELSNICEIINGGRLPLRYILSNELIVQPSFSKECKIIAQIITAILLLGVSVYMIIKYKFEGLKKAIFGIGYIATLLFVFRYVRVAITFNSSIALIGVILINYAFLLKVLKKQKENTNLKVVLKESLKELYLAIIPICIVAVIFTFMSGVVINSIGMTLFWGLLLQVVLSLLMLV